MKSYQQQQHAGGSTTRRAAVRPSCRSRTSRGLAVSALLKPADGLSGVTWHQTTDEVIISVPVGAETRGRDVACEVHPTRLSLAVGGRPLLAGSLPTEGGGITVDDCFWVLEDQDEQPQASSSSSGSSSGGRVVVITLAKATSGFESWPALLEDDVPDDSITHRVALDVQVGDGPPGRLVLGLCGNVVPKTVANFVSLVTGDAGVGQTTGVPLALRGSPFHRIIPGFMAQGGDISARDGTGGESIYGPAFDDENFKVKHSARGSLAMANAGPNTNNSQFYITFGPTPHLDGRHVVFGRVEAGWGTLMRMEGAGSDSGTPVSPVSVVACSLLPLDVDPQEAVDALEDAQHREDAMAAEFAAEFDSKQGEEQEQGEGPEQNPAAAAGA